MLDRVSICFLLVIIGCSKQHPESTDQIDPDQSIQPVLVPEPTTVGIPAGSEYQLNRDKDAVLRVPARASLQLFLAHRGDLPPPVTFVDVNPIFQKCVACHGSNQRRPDLSSFPFAGLDGDSLSDVVAKISLRMNDAARPMPPQGLLPEDERAVVNSWVTSGHLGTPPSPQSSPEFSAYTLFLQWTIDGVTSVATLDGNDAGLFVQDLGPLLVGTNVALSVKVVGPRNIVVVEKTFENLGLPRSGVLNIPMAGIALDALPPTPGDHGEVRMVNATHDAISLGWTQAFDSETVAHDLTYSVYQSSSDVLDTIPHIKTAGILLGSTHANRLTWNATGLTPSVRYFFNVIVSDAFGNEAAYVSKSFTTDEDPSVIAVSEYPNCLSPLPTRSVLTAWRSAAARDLQNGISDSVVGDRVRRCFPNPAPSCIQPILDYTARGDIAEATSDMPFANAPQRQPPTEFLAAHASGYEYVIPADIEHIASSRGWPVVRYKSRHAGGFDSDTANLLMVYVPGDRVNPPVSYDRWLNFATPHDSDATALTPLPQARLAIDSDYAINGGVGLPKVFTMVSLERRVGARPAEVYFQMFDRRPGSPKFVPRANSDVTGCVSCHPNGLRAISPLGLHVRDGEPQLPERDWLAAKEINAAMISSAGSKTVSWRSATAVDGVRKPFLNPINQGPILGPVTPLNVAGSRTEEFIMGSTLPDGTPIRGCFNRRPTVQVVDIFGRAPGLNNIYALSSNPAIRWTKVRDAMTCARCHDNVGRSSINQTVDMSQVDFKILVDQSMPLGAHANPLDQDPGGPAVPVRDDLSGDERIALANCLAVEFELEKSELQKWLSQTSCQ